MKRLCGTTKGETYSKAALTSAKPPGRTNLGREIYLRFISQPVADRTWVFLTSWGPDPGWCSVLKGRQTSCTHPGFCACLVMRVQSTNLSWRWGTRKHAGRWKPRALLAKPLVLLTFPAVKELKILFPGDLFTLKPC